MRLDFSQLYAQLEIEPDCSLEDFRRAYRRRIAALHPDRGQPPREANPASELNVLYEHAIDFHRRYGRLPGAPPTAPDATEQDLRRSRVVLPGRPSPAASQRTSRHRRGLWLALILALIGSMLWDSFAWRLGI